MTYLTIPNFELLTDQEAFDLSVNHILTNGPSFEEDTGKCMYAGTGCAASVFLLPEARESSDANGGVSWWGIVNSQAAPTTNQQLIQSLQSAHDRSIRNANEEPGLSFMGEWLPKVAQIAHNYGLSMDAFAIH